MKRIISALLLVAVALPFASCGFNNAVFDNGGGFIIDSQQGNGETSKTISQNPFTENFQQPDDSAADEFIENFQQTDFGEEINRLLNKKITLEKPQLDNVTNLFSGLYVKYPYQELYGSQEQYKEYLKLPEYVSTHENYFAEGVFDYNRLFEIVKANNAAAGYPGTDDYIEDEDLKYICSIVAPVLLDASKKIPEASARLLSEKVSMLKIMQYNEFSFGFYDPLTNRMGFDLGFKNNDQFESTICHETQHLIQSSSYNEQTQLGIYYRMGYGYRFDEENDQPLALNWLSECSAEMLAQNLFNSHDYHVYEYNITHLELIKTATILDPDIGSTTIEELSYSNKLESVFDYFKCETDKDKEEVLNMLTSIDHFANLQSSADPFIERYESTYGVDFDEHNYRYQMYNSLGQTLIKYYFTDLAELIEGETITVEELFLLNAFFEHSLCNLALVADGNIIKDMLFLYRDAQTALFTAACKDLDIGVDELQNAYDIYYTDAVLNAYEISLISKPEAKYLQHTTDSAINKRFYSINQYIIIKKL